MSFILGVFIGGFIGTLLMGIMVVAKTSDQRAESFNSFRTNP